jgi:hypothetical protein
MRSLSRVPSRGALESPAAVVTVVPEELAILVTLLEEPVAAHAAVPIDKKMTRDTPTTTHLCFHNLFMY